MATNPFAAFGDYRQAAASQTSDDLVTLSYLTGLPDPKSLADPQLTIVFKNLLRKDPHTKDRALNELTAALQELDYIDEAVHLAWIQIYAKLSFDLNAGVRLKAHKILGLLYSKLGKKSTKFLKYSIGPWLAGTHDTDVSVAMAAQDAFDTVFPGEKKQLAVKKLEDSVVEFVVQLVSVQQPATMSDERYVSKDDSLQKYNLAVKAAVDIVLGDFENLNPSTNVEIEHLSSGPFWKFLPSQNPYLTKSVIALATSWIDFVDDFKSVLWKQLLKALRIAPLPVSVDMIRFLTLVTRKFPELWDINAVAALAQFIGLGAQRPKIFFPLLFNLVMSLPDAVSIATNDTSANQILKAMVTQVPSTVGETEPSAWGCYLALSTKPASKAKFTMRAMETVAIRAKRPMSHALVKAVGDRFKDFADIQGTADIVSKHLDEENFAKIVASSGAFQEELQAAINSLPTKTIAEILSLEPNLKIDITGRELEPELLDIAIKSNGADSQGILDSLLPKFTTLVLERAQELAPKGVKGDATTLVDESDPSSLAAAVGAHGVFVTDQQASQYLIKLVEMVMDGDDAAVAQLARAVKLYPDFCQNSLGNYSGHQQLLAYLYELDSPVAARLVESLSSKDNAGLLVTDVEATIVNEHPEVDMLVARAQRLLPQLTAKELSSIIFVEADWKLANALAVPSTAQWIYPIGCYPLVSGEAADSWNSTLARAVYVLHVVNDGRTLDKLPADQQATVLVDLALTASAARGVAFSEESYELAKAFAEDSDAFFDHASINETVASRLWELTSGNDAVSFHAAQVLARVWPKEKLAEKAAGARAAFQKPSIRGALLAQSGAVKDTPWYDREQAMLLRELGSAASFTMIDANMDAEKLAQIVSSKATSLDQEALVQALRVLDQAGGLVDLAVAERALEGDRNSQFALLKLVKVGEFPHQIALAAGRLDSETTEFDHELARLYLNHAKAELASPQETGLSAMYSLALSEAETLPWIAFCYLRNTVVEEYKTQLDASLEQTELPHELSALLEQDRPLTGWLLYLACVQTYAAASDAKNAHVATTQVVFSQYSKINDAILGYVGRALDNADVAELVGIKPEEPVVGSQSDAVNAVHLLFNMSLLLGGSVRAWYRELRDRRQLKSIADVLAAVILPGIMRSISKVASEMRDNGSLEATSVSELSREFRALVDFDDSSVEIVISLPDVYPTKPVHVELKNLAGVPEGKKRSWVLEAEHKAQNGAIVPAMRALVTKIGNYLEGIEPCAICYQLLLNGKTLPSRTCSTCHNTFHSECLGQWFTSNGNKLCPMCRSPF